MIEQKNLDNFIKYLDVQLNDKLRKSELLALRKLSFFYRNEFRKYITNVLSGSLNQGETYTDFILNYFRARIFADNERDYSLVMDFGDRRLSVTEAIMQAYGDGKRVVVWGSGSKCVAFLITLDVRDEIEYVVDINPFRHGKYLPGVGKKVLSPEILRRNKPDLVIVMNPIYNDEICQMLDDMNVIADVVSV